MATVNIGDQRVLVVKIEAGEISSVSDESRSVYENTKGRFIKTVSDGQIFLTDDNHAYIAYKNVKSTRGTWWVRRQYTPTKQEVESLLHMMFTTHGLDGFIK